jgi:Uma2 family endonuclease
MSATLPDEPMTAEAFVAWAEQQPKGQRYELVDGHVTASPRAERVGHGRIKAQLARRLGNALEVGALLCETYIDAMAVRIDDHVVYEPDIVVRCGAALDEELLFVSDPLIVVEVVSRSSAKRDTGAKLDDYFRIASLRHYLIVKPDNKAIIHHERGPDGTITTRIIRDGHLRLDPPGIELDRLFS